MPNFKFRAVSVDGTEATGVVEAYDEFEAVDIIRQRGQILKSIKEVDQEKTSILNRKIGNPMIKEKTIALMCSQFSIVLRAGMPIVRATEMIAGQTKDKELKALLEKVAEDVSGGYSLASSFENKGGEVLPLTFIETVRSGEASGSLDVAFARLQVYFEKSAKVKEKVKSAMIYPIFLLVLATIVIGIVMIKAMPVFIDTFLSLDMELPSLTVFLMSMSDFFSTYWMVIVGIILAIALALRAYGRTENGKMFFAKNLLKIPIIGDVSGMKGASQLANTLNTMLSSGLTMVKAVSVCSRVLDNYYLGTRLETAVVGLEEGKPLVECLHNCDCFPLLLVEMIGVGEQAGNLEETLDTIGLYFDNETEQATARALGALQPAITVIMGIVIGFVVVALYLPMFTMYGGM